MINNFSFQTRARTIDHLGREQIADCPTAISELWKNAYDAYAKNVSLHIFDEEQPIAAILDDGHGMNLDEFINKWLVIGTDSKVTKEDTKEVDRNGLPIRPRQGQKGIGRLSSAAMGPFLLLISKRKNFDFVGALIDWRLFENPYLMLSDISLPIIEFESKQELLKNLPQMFEAITNNVLPQSKDKERNERIELAWELFDKVEKDDGAEKTTSDLICETVIETVFEQNHLEKWSVWKDKAESGTALFVSGISFELRALLDDRSNSVDGINEELAQNVFKTLCGFYDPYKEETSNLDEFNYEVILWEQDTSREFLAKDTQFKLKDLHNLEHSVDGRFDSSGIFHGKVRVFGEDLGEIEIPPTQLITGNSARDRVGPFEIVVGTYEVTRSNSSHTLEEHSEIHASSEKYSGLGVYRDNLRVLPYGKPENDFFEMERQRSQRAGTFIWSNRRTFGRIAITRNNNKSLKDKAGREGLIDNRARNIFKNLVADLLKEVSVRYFGSDSVIRQEKLPVIQAANAQYAANEAKKQKRNNLTLFRKILKANQEPLDSNFENLSFLKQEMEECIKAKDGDALYVVLENVRNLKNTISELRLPPPPRKLGPLEDDFNDYKTKFSTYSETLNENFEKLNVEIEKLKPRSPAEIASSALRSNAKALHDKLRSWKNESTKILEGELKKINEKVKEENKLYDLKTRSLINDLETGRTGLVYVLTELDEIRNRLDEEYSSFYEPYIRSITQLKDGIDLDSASNWNSERADELEKDLEQFTELAQLGITIELVSHELERLDHTIGNHLRDLPPEVQQTKTFQSAFDAHTELMERLRFLSPLKLSGRSTSRTLITGERITVYLLEFFKRAFEINKINFEVSEEFKKIEFEEYRSRIYPVFINLINNSRYWVAQKEGERKISIDIVQNKIVVGDNGPGVSITDQRNLFKLFFTKRIQGRGVGLYLCKANLARGRHKIEYATEDKFKILSGANFVIEIKGL